MTFDTTFFDGNAPSKFFSIYTYGAIVDIAEGGTWQYSDQSEYYLGSTVFICVNRDGDHDGDRSEHFSNLAVNVDGGMSITPRYIETLTTKPSSTPTKVGTKTYYYIYAFTMPDADVVVTG